MVKINQKNFLIDFTLKINQKNFLIDFWGCFAARNPLINKVKKALHKVCSITPQSLLNFFDVSPENPLLLLDKMATRSA